MELIENISALENLNANDNHAHIMAFSGETFSDQQQQQEEEAHNHHHHHVPMNFTDNIQSFSHSDHHDDQNTVLLDHHSMVLNSDHFGSQTKKEKVKRTLLSNFLLIYILCIC